MNKKEIAQKIIKNKDGIAKTAGYTAAGIKNYEVSGLVRKVSLKESSAVFISFPTIIK